MTGNTPADLRRWVLDPPVSPAAIRLPEQEEDEADLGQGFELLQTRTWTEPQTKREIKWDERVLVLQSAKLAASKRKGLAQCLARTEAAFQKLKVKADDDLGSLTEKIQALLKQHKVSPYLEVTWTAQVTEHKRYLKRGRHGPNSPFEMVETTTWVRTIPAKRLRLRSSAPWPDGGFTSPMHRSVGWTQPASSVAIASSGGRNGAFSASRTQPWLFCPYSCVAMSAFVVYCSSWSSCCGRLRCSSSSPGLVWPNNPNHCVGCMLVTPSMPPAGLQPSACSRLLTT
jgi:hypothetical protein